MRSGYSRFAQIVNSPEIVNMWIYGHDIEQPHHVMLSGNILEIDYLHGHIDSPLSDSVVGPTCTAFDETASGLLGRLDSSLRYSPTPSTGTRKLELNGAKVYALIRFLW